MAEVVAPGDSDQLHHFVSESKWEDEPILRVLAQKGSKLLGSQRSHLIIDGTALVKKGSHSVGVSHQYCGELGKQANCQDLVSLTLSKDEAPLPLRLRLYLPKDWSEDVKRRRKARVLETVEFAPKWQLALQELDQLLSYGVTFGDVLADAGYGNTAEFRRQLSKRGLRWAVGISSNTHLYEDEALLYPPERHKRGRPQKHHQTDAKSVNAKSLLSKTKFRQYRWRRRTDGSWLTGKFSAMRVRPTQTSLARSRRRGA